MFFTSSIEFLNAKTSRNLDSSRFLVLPRADHIKFILLGQLAVLRSTSGSSVGGAVIALGGSLRQKAMNCQHLVNKRDNQGWCQPGGWVQGDTERAENSEGRARLLHGLDFDLGFWGIPPWRHQLRLFLCSCTVNKWFYGTRLVRLSLV